MSGPELKIFLPTNSLEEACEHVQLVAKTLIENFTGRTEALDDYLFECKTCGFSFQLTQYFDEDLVEMALGICDTIKLSLIVFYYESGRFMFLKYLNPLPHFLMGIGSILTQLLQKIFI